ncbi:MAG TPA: Arc family DNA-binding protein [Thermoanaerobaculia bacterium]|nr:Arc family DNA-binding protein [Thermoanaerobaculia bacterium]
MARLRINNFPDPLYKRLKEQAERNHRSLSQEVIHVLDQALEPEKTLSILGLRGLGKEIWAGIDAVEYIRAERDSWDKE